MALYGKHIKASLCQLILALRVHLNMNGQSATADLITRELQVSRGQAVSKGQRDNSRHRKDSITQLRTPHDLKPRDCCEDCPQGDKL